MFSSKDSSTDTHAPLDTKSWVEFADTLTVDATAIYGEQLSFDSRDSFVSFLENTLGSHIITEHQCGQPEIDVDGDTATGIWCLADTVVIPEDGHAASRIGLLSRQIHPLQRR